MIVTWNHCDITSRLVNAFMPDEPAISATQLDSSNSKHALALAVADFLLSHNDYEAVLKDIAESAQANVNPFVGILT